MSQPLRKDDAPPVSYRDQQADQKADTRRRILEAAREVFLQTSFMEANLNEVATRAGVGKGTLYRHFASKGELYIAMLIHKAGAFADEVDGIVDSERSALRKIEALGNLYLEFWREHPQHFRMFWALENRDLIGPLSPELLDQVRVEFERPLRRLDGLIRSGIANGELRPVDPWGTATMIATCATAMIRPIVRGSDSVVVRDLSVSYRQFLDVVQAGLARDGS